jgi:sugar lactone lactonase YvrE
VAEVEPRAIFYHVAADGSAKVADEGFVICNGPAFSPDNRNLYFSDSLGRRILVHNLDASGNLSRRRTFIAFSSEDGVPDGLTVDSAGNVWCALYGGGKVVCIGPEGRITRSLALPTAHVTSLCFGGPDLTTLYVTTGWTAGTTEETKQQDIGGLVYMRPIDCPGLPEPIVRLPA